MAVFLDEERVDAVLDANLRRDKQLVRIVEATIGATADSHTDATLPRLTPFRLGIIKHVLAVDIIDVGSPDATIGNEVHGTCMVVESRTRKDPVDEVFGTVDGNIVRILCRIEVEESIRSLDNRRVRQTIVDDRILIGITGLDCTRQAGQ